MIDAKNEREFKSLTWEEFKVLCSALDLNIDKCYYCKDKITKTSYGLFNKPTRMICSSPLCVCEVMEEQEAKK